MIKFFRKIRFDLMETGKTGKYLKYAIGEIILVVIGIVIALQLNQWNEARKNQESLDTYISSLIIDMKQDSIILSSIINDANVDNINLKKISDRLSSPYSNIDTLKQIARYELNSLFRAYRPPNSNTLLAMQSNGTIELFDETTYNLLIELQTTQKIAASIVKGNIAMHTTQYLHYIEKYTLSDEKVIDGPLSEKAWQNIDEDDLYRRVESFLTSKMSMNTFSNQIRYQLLELTEKVLNRLIAIQDNGLNR